MKDIAAKVLEIAPAQLLQAVKIELIHPTTGKKMKFKVPLEKPFEQVLKLLKKECPMDAPVFDDADEGFRDFDPEMRFTEEEEEFINNILASLNNSMYETPPANYENSGTIKIPYNGSLTSVGGDTITAGGESGTYQLNIKVAILQLLEEIIGDLESAGVELGINIPENILNLSLEDIRKIAEMCAFSWDDKYQDGEIVITYNCAYESSGTLLFKDGDTKTIDGYVFQFSDKPTPHWDCVDYEA
jgi:hypothetical protein